MRIILIILGNALALWGVASFVPGIRVDDFMTAIVAAIVLGILNTFLKPILSILTLPVTFITFGLFSWVISAFVLWLAGKIVPGFDVQGFVSALVGGIILAFLASLLQTLVKK